MRKRRVATAAVVAAMVGVLGFSVPAFAAGGYGSVKVTKNEAEKTITIGNEAITRTFSWQNNKLKPGKIENKLDKNGGGFTPAEGSEEFVIQPMTPADRTEPADGTLTSVKPLPGKPAVKPVLSGSEYDKSQGEGGKGDGAQYKYAIDGDPNTYWASTKQEAGTAHLIVDFGAEKQVKSVVYTARNSNGSYNCTGAITKYKLYIWKDGAWKDAPVAEGEFANITTKGTGEITLADSVTTQKIKLVAVKSHMWDDKQKNMYANVAELEVKNDKGENILAPGSSDNSWKVEVSSNSTNSGDNGGPQAIIDGNPSTYWHSRYDQGEGEKKLPATITIDRGNKKDQFQTVGYLSRPTDSNGNWAEFEVYASDDKSKLFDEANKQQAEGGSTTFKPLYDGMYGSANAGAKWNYFALKQPVDKQYVGIKVLSGKGNYAAASEVDLFSGEFTTTVNKENGAIKASGLTVKDCTETKVDGGTMLTFTFDPFEFGTDSTATVEMKVVMYDGDHFMRKWIELKTTDKETRVKFIDGEHLNVGKDDTTWTIPTDNSGVVQMPKERANLGQPFYINGMFFGSEFPVADTQIVSEGDAGKTARSRYWTGKNFGDFKRDGQLTTDGKYVSWQTVCGASHSDGSDIKVVQSDFFAYVDAISKPSDFRIQYNSWFDNMMFIDDENIIESFKAVDKHLSETGVRPLESYVVDDGWNNYRPAEGQLMGPDDIRRNGEGVNTDGFWTFNSKFPDGLTPSSSLVKKLGSNFGVWIGPRGGYNYYGQLAGIMANAGKGSEAGGSIDVADQRYVTNFKDMAIDWMKQYDVNYWKWDGFADKAQYNAFNKGDSVAGYDANHQHMYGGPNGYFHSTDLWEKWIVLFDEVWKTADEEQIKDLWVSLTCYVNPSPWFLQWSNSVWIQCVGDRGEVHGGAGDDKMNAMLTYRDACYYEFINTNQYQFPLASVYNHDPIYGKEGTGINADSMNGEQFRNYLFMQGTRGTAFWELYYSDSLFNDEKYLINADFLEWEEKNFKMLRNAKWIGGDPAPNAGLTSGTTVTEKGVQNAYGFAGFNNAGDEGIISMRNPDNVEQTITFKLDAGIGCTSEGTYQVVRDHVYTEKGQAAAEAPKTINHGETVTVKLKPGETQVWHLSKNGDTTAPTLSKLYTENNTTMRVQASEHVYGAQFEVYIDGKKVELGEDAIKAYADLKTFDITLPSAPADGVTVEVKATAGADAAGNALEGAKIDRTFHTDNIVGQVSNPECPNLATQAGSIKGTNGFAAVATVNSAAPGTVLISQGSEWELGVNADGYAYFTVGDVTAASQTKVAGATSIAGVRENNGMLKVYVGGEIDGNGYDAAKSVEHNVSAAPIKVNNKGVVAKATVYDRSLGYDEIPAAPLAELVETVKALKDKVTEKSWTDNNIDTLLEAAKAALTGNDPAVQQQAYDALLEGYGKLVPGLGEPQPENLALDKIPTASWLPGKDGTGSVENSGRPLSKATDGEFDSADTYAIFGNDAAKKPAYMQIDLGEGANIEDVKLYRYWTDGRTYADTALVVSNDPEFANIKAEDVLYYSYKDEDNKDVFDLGVNATKQTYQETKDGKTIFESNGKPVTARYVRLYGNGKVDNGVAAAGDNHIVELLVNGTRTVKLGDPYGVDALDALIQRGDAAMKDKADYTDESIKKLEEALAPAKELSEKVHEQIEAQEFETAYGEFNAVRDALQVALGCLELKPVEPGPGPDSQPTYVTVTFDDMVDGTANKEVKVLKGSKVSKPEDPVREGYAFAGWYADEALTEAYDFGSAVNEDTVLYAKWTEDGGSEQPEPPVDPEDPNKPGKPEDPNKPGDPGKPEDPNKPGKPGAGNKPSKPGLPQTGDNTLFMVGGIMVVAVAALVAGFYLKRRRS